GDIPEEDVHHDIEAAEAALADMMMDLEDVMPDEDEAAAALGLDEEKAAAAMADAPSEDIDLDGPTIADANVDEMMARAAAQQKAKADAKPAKAEPKKAEPKAEPRPEPRKAEPKKAATPVKGAGAGMGLGGVLALI